MWYFYSPNIIYGEDALNFLENIPGDKCFIVTDKVMEELGYLKILTDKLEKYGKQYNVYNEILPNPRETHVAEAREMCNSYTPDLILALGGGSVMDAAKMVWCFYEFPELSLDDIHPFRPDLHNMGKKAKLVAIPTTSGTGAETTYAAIISKFENDIWKKFLYAHKGIVPTYAIVDPIFPVGMPSNLTADTGFDALAHAIEGMGSEWRNEFSDALGVKAIELVFKYLPIAIKEGKNMEARDYMHQAATMAGLAFGNGNVHIGHGMGHSLGAIFHIPHGRAVGVVLSYVTQFCLNNPDEKDKSIEIYAKLAKQLGWSNWDVDNKKAAFTVIEKIKELQKEIGIPNKIQDLGISREDFDKNLDMLITLCYEDATIGMVPRSVNPEIFKNLFTYAYDGKNIDF